jgi:biopolymer transport protein ExbB
MTISPELEVMVRWATFVPLIACSVIGLAITLAKLLQFRRPHRPAQTIMDDVTRLAAEGDLQGASARAAGDDSSGSRLIEAAASCADRPRELIKEEVVRVGSELGDQVEYGLGGLSLLAALGPLFGLLGTVIGIVLVFNRLAASGGVSTPEQLAGGIGTALYTTIAGLVVGILALVAHRYLEARADQVVRRLEAFGAQAVDLFDRGRR